jgi:hypothetical protein
MIKFLGLPNINDCLHLILDANITPKDVREHTALNGFPDT